MPYFRLDREKPSSIPVPSAVILLSFKDCKNYSLFLMTISSNSLVYSGTLSQVIHNEIDYRLRIIANDSEIFSKVNIFNCGIHNKRLCQKSYQ